MISATTEVSTITLQTTKRPLREKKSCASVFLFTIWKRECLFCNESIGFIQTTQFNENSVETVPKLHNSMSIQSRRYRNESIDQELSMVNHWRK